MLPRKIQEIYQNSVKKIKENKLEFAIFFLIFLSGVFFRAYHFASWLHFEIDQTYDIKTIAPAIKNGIFELPLFGPNVGGSALRLGPAFYYIEYISALIFGNTPPGHAMAVLLLNIAAIPLFYAYCRKYFSKEISLGLNAIFTFSLFCIMYSRFSWSPNVLPFFMLFSFYSLLQTFTKKEKHPARWFLLAVTSVTITSQIHFNAFFVAPIIAILFTIYKKPKFAWKVWLAAVGIIFIIYSPMIASDAKMHGQNFKLFKQKFKKTTEVATSRTESIVHALEYNAYGNWFILTSDDEINGIQLKNFGFECTDCQNNLPIKIIALIIFAASSIILCFEIIKEKNSQKKDFLVLSFLWLLVSLYLFYTISKSYRMYPRFYLIISPLTIVLWGFILKYLKPETSRLRLAILVSITLVFISLNMLSIFPVFHTLSVIPRQAIPNIQSGDIFPQTNRLTYEEEQRVVNYIISKQKLNNYPVYLSAKPDYAYTLWFMLEQKGIEHYDEFNNRAIYAKGNYFVIKLSDERITIDKEFDIIEKQDLGSLIVYYLKPLPQYIKYQRQPASDRKTIKEDSVINKINTWKKLFQ